MNNQLISPSFPAWEALTSPQLGPDSAPSPSAKSTRIARKSSRKTSTLFLRTLKASDAEKQGRNNLPHQVQHGYKGTFLPTLTTMDTIERDKMRPSRAATNRKTGYLSEAILPDYTGTFGAWTDDDTPESTCLPLAFPASPQAKPGSDEAVAMTAGSGRTLYESLVKHSHLSPCLKTLLASLLLSTDWYSRICFLKWKATVTKSRHRLSFQLVPLEPGTDETESSLLPTLSAGELNGGGTDSEVRKANGNHVRLRDMLPTLSARDWKSEKSNMHGQNSRPLSEVVGLMPTLRADKRGVPDSHGNVSQWSGLKLTSAFCERFMGFPKD